MKKIFLALGAALLCTISLAQPPMGGGFPGGGFPGGGFPGGMPPGMMGMFGMDASSFSSVEVAKAQAQSLANILDLTDKQQKKVYKVELKVADERYMDLLKEQSNNRQRGGGMPRGDFGPGRGGFPGGMPPGGFPGMDGQEQQQDEMTTSEDMISDVKLLKKYDGMRVKKFSKILTPEQIEKWEHYKEVRYERAKQRAELEARQAAEAAEAAASGQQQQPSGAPAGN